MKKTGRLESSVVVFVIAAVLLVLEWRVTYHMVDALSTYGTRDGVTERTVYLGTEDKKINIFVPEKASKEDDVQSGTRIITGNNGGPSDFALSQLIAHCPSLVEERNVLELGCGLGMVSAVMCKYSNPNHVAITGRDNKILSIAYASCVQLQRSKSSVSRCCMDWKEPSTWPAQEYDMLVAADVLYDNLSILPLVNVIRHYLYCNEAKVGVGTKKQAQAVIVDPINQLKHRWAFCTAAKRAGLYVDQQEFPGRDDLMLLRISPSGKK